MLLKQDCETNEDNQYLLLVYFTMASCLCTYSCEYSVF